MKQFCYQKRPIFISTGPLISDNTALLRRQYINHELLNLNANAINNHLYHRKGWWGGGGRKEMFYLTTQSTHFIYGLYGVGHMVKS